MASRLLERDIQRLIIAWLKKQKKIEIWRQNNHPVYDPTRKIWRRHVGMKGMSDIIGIAKPSGKWIAIEVKRPKMKPTDDQQAFLNMINDFGGLGFCAHSLEECEVAIGLFLKTQDSTLI